MVVGSLLNSPLLTRVWSFSSRQPLTRQFTSAISLYIDCRRRRWDQAINIILFSKLNLETKRENAWFLSPMLLGPIISLPLAPTNQSKSRNYAHMHIHTRTRTILWSYDPTQETWILPNLTHSSAKSHFQISGWDFNSHLNCRLSRKIGATILWLPSL